MHPFDNGEMTIRDELLSPWPRTEDEIRRTLHEYYATISGLDHHIGRLLQTLKDLRVDENPAQNTRVAQMMARMRQWQKQLGDPDPLMVEHPQPAAFTPPTGQELKRLKAQ